MKRRIAIAVVCLLAFTVVGAYAGTIIVREDNYAALGWKKTLKPGSDGLVGSIAFSLLAENWENGLMLLSSRSTNTINGFSGLSMSLAPGTLLSSVTTLRIRSMETQGVLTEPIAPGLGVVVEGVTHCIRPLPYETRGYRGVQWVMEEYDLLGSMLWFDTNGNVKMTWDTFLATYPNAQLATDAEVDGGIPSGQNFNMFAGQMAPGATERPYGRDQRGQVDWCDIAFDGGEVTRYDFNAPEPSSIMALLTGVVGLVALRRRR